MIVRGQFTDFFLETMLPALNAKVFQAFKQKPRVFTKIFQTDTTNRSIEQFSQVSGVGYFGTINELGDVRFDQPVQGYDKTFKPARFGLGVEVSQDIVEDDKIGLVKRMAVELGYSCYETQEIQAASVFNNAFTAAAYAGPDAVALCSASHPLIKAGGLQSNILSAPADLDVTSLELALTDWELLKKSNGQQMSLPTPRILVAPANRWNAHEILKGTWRSDTANHTINAFVYGENGPVDQIIVWPKLTDTDAWFLVAPPEFTSLLWLWRRQAYTKGGFDDKSEKGYTIMRYKSDVGFYDYVGVYGTPGA